MPARTDIKERVVTVIKNASSIAGARVYIGRQNVLPSAATGFPLVYVYMMREDVDTLTMGASGRHQTRTMTLGVDYWAKSANVATLEAGMDTACALIEAAINVDSRLNGKAEDIVLTSCEYVSEGDEDQPFGRAAMQFRVTYFANES